MPTKRVSTSASVTLTRDELVRLRDLQRIAWGHDSKAYKKLVAAIERIDQRNQA
jgi:hypothetical protein